MAYFWPAIGALVPFPNDDSPNMPSSGASIDAEDITPYVRGLVSSARILDYDPLGGEETPEVDSFASAIYVTHLATRVGDFGGQTIGLAGYSEPDDGGEGIVWWDATEDAAADGITSYGTNPTGRWKRPQGPLNPRHAGAKGDDETNDTDAFNTMRLAAIARNPQPVEVYIPPGDYRLVHPRWWKGINNLTIRQPGATFKNVGTTGALAQGYLYAADTAACCLGDSIWVDTADQLDGFGSKENPPAAGSINTQAYLINAAAAGDETVTTTTAAHAGNLAADDYAMIYGFDQQDTASYPPNPRYFEYKRVVSVNAGTGVVTLDSPLRHRYRADWYNTTHSYGTSCGPARIVKLTRDNYQWSESLIMYGGEFLPFDEWDNHTNGTLYVTGVRNVELYNVKAKGVVTSECENVYYKRCSFVPVDGQGDVETDKCVDRIVFDECTIKSHTQGSGCNYMEFRNCDLFGEFQVRARVMVLTGNRAATLNGSGTDTVLVSATGYATHSITLRDNRFYITSDDVAGIVAEGNVYTFVVADVPSANVLKVHRGTYGALRQYLEQGTKLWTYNTSSVNSAVVTDFYEDVDHTYIECRDLQRPASIGDEFRFFTCQQSVDGGGNVFYGKPDVSTLYTSPYRVFMSRGGAVPGPQTDRLIDMNALAMKLERSFIIKNVGFYNENLNGYITRIVVNVQRAYTGADAVCALRLQHAFLPNKTFGYIDCKEVGFREWRIGSHVTLPEDDALLAPTDIEAATPLYCQRTQFRMFTTSGTDPDEAEMPIVTVHIEATPLV